MAYNDVTLINVKRSHNTVILKWKINEKRIKAKAWLIQRIAQ